MAARKQQKQKPHDGQTASEPEFRPIAGWTPGRIDTARVLADGGDLTYAADLCERIMGDERALGPLQALCGIADLPIEFESARGLEADPVVEALEIDFWEFADDDTVGEALRWMVILGVALVRVREWRLNDVGRVVPVLEVWNPRNLLWDRELRSWRVKVGDFCELRTIEPGDSEWIVLTPYGKKRPWAKAPWFGLGTLWLFAQYARIDWGDWNDNHSKPFRVAEQKDSSGGAIPDETTAAQFATRIAKLVRGGSIVMPEGMTLRLLESVEKGWESFVKLIAEVWPAAVAIALTGNNLATEVKGGSYAAATVHYQVSFDRIRTLAATLSTTLRKQLFTWWAEFNFGDAKLAPFAEYDCTPPADPKAEAERFATGSQALKNLLDSGVPPEAIDVRKLREQYDLPLADDLKILPPKPAAPTPPVAPAAPPPAKPADQAQVTMLASGKSAPDGLVAGQDYSDRVADALAEELRSHLAPHMREMLRIVDEAESLESAELEIATHYRDKMNANSVAKLFAASMKMVGVAGSAAVTKDAEPNAEQ